MFIADRMKSIYSSVASFAKGAVIKVATAPLPTPDELPTRFKVPTCDPGDLPRRGAHAKRQRERNEFARKLNGSHLNRAQRRQLARAIVFERVAA